MENVKLVRNTEKMKMTPEMITALQVPFPDEALSEIPGKSYLTSIKAMYVIERLNQVFGTGRWSFPTEIVERTQDYVLVRGKFVSEDYDVVAVEQYGGHKTVGVGTEIADGYKSAVTDALTKVASYLGVGIDVFKGQRKLPKSGAKNLERYVVSTFSEKPVKSTETTQKTTTADKEWYNNFFNDEQNIIQAIKDGKHATDILKSLREKFKVSKKTESEILALEVHYHNR